MTSDFVEQFGFSEEDFAEQEECIGSVVLPVEFHAFNSLPAVRMIDIAYILIQKIFSRKLHVNFK